MSESPDSAAITQDDIVFECDSCGKSMAINRKGAGITIACPECGDLVQVPEYQGPPRSDDNSKVQVYEMQIQKLTISLKELSARRKYLEQLRTEHLSQLDVIKNEFAVIQQALDRINDSLMNSEH